MNYRIAWPITFQAFENLNFEGNVFWKDACFKVRKPDQPLIYLSGSRGATRWDFGGPDKWIRIGFRAFDNWGHQIYWVDDHWHYKRDLPTRLELLMEGA